MSTSDTAKQETVAERQIQFRHLNETIQATAEGLPILGPIPFVCECPDLECIEIVRLTFDEYEAVRRHPRHFFNAPNHEARSVELGAETILIVFDQFTIVEKIGVAGDLAETAHGASA